MDLSCVHKALVTFTKTAVKYQQQRFNMQKISMILTHLKTLDNSQCDSYRQKWRVCCVPWNSNVYNMCICGTKVRCGLGSVTS